MTITDAHVDGNGKFGALHIGRCLRLDITRRDFAVFRDLVIAEPDCQPVTIDRLSVFTKGELQIALAMALAAALDSAPVTFTLTNLVSPSPSFTI